MAHRLWLVCASALAIVSFAVSAAGLDACLPLPLVPVFTAPAVVCPGSAHNHAAVANVQPGVTYTWSVAGGNATITSPPTGTAIDFDAGTSGTVEFNVTATNSCGPTAGSLRIAIDEPSPVTIMGAPAACANATGNQLAVAAQPGDTFLWTMQNGTITSGATSGSITYTAGPSGLVAVSVRRTSACGVVSTGATEVAIDSPLLPRIFATLPGTFLAEADSVCAGETVNVSAPDFGPEASYTWTITNASNVTTDGRNASFAAGPGGTTDISLAVTVCGVSGTATRSMAINQPPALDIMSASAACPTATNSAFVKPLPGATYAWQIANGTIAGPSSSSFIFYDTGAAGEVTLTLTETRCGFSSTQTKVVPIDDEIDVPLVVGRPDAQSVCPGAPAQAGLTVIGAGETYSWSVTNGRILSPADGSSITFLAPTSGSVTVTANVLRCGTTSSKSITLPVTSPPVATITAPAMACGQGLTASVPPVEGGYHWTIVNGTITAGEYERTVTFTPGSSGNVTLNVLIGTMCGRFATSSVTIPIGTQPVTITGPGATCPSGTVELDAGPGFASYLWSTGATTRKITVAPADTTQYTVTAVIAGGCQSSDTHTVTVHATPAVTITGPGATCPSGIVELDAGPRFAAYHWSTGATTRQITVNPVSTTSYDVTVTDVNGCQGAGSHTVTVTPGPDASITTRPDQICRGQQGVAWITEQPGTILWTVTNGTIVAGQGTPNLLFDAGASGTVDITATVTTSSCTARGSKSIPIATPVVHVSGPDRTCFATPVTLDAGPGFDSYHWSVTDDRGLQVIFALTQQITVAPQATTTYGVRVWNAAGCTTTATKTVTVDPKPTITADTGTTAVTLTASPGLSYRWSTGATTRSIVVTSTGTYGVSVVGTDGCEVAADAMLVQFVPTGNYRTTAGSLELNLPNVTSPGSMAITAIDPLSAGALPDGYDPSPVPLAYDIRTSALYTAPLTVAFLFGAGMSNGFQAQAVDAELDDSALSAGQFAALRILHGENGVLVDRTVSSDYTTGTIVAEVGSLGSFVLARTTAPALGGISGPAAPVATQASATVTASFSSPAAPNRVSVDWGESASAAAVTEANGEGSAAASHVYAAAGVYPVTMTLVNAAGVSTSRTFQYVVVYDPNGGFVTGGGTIPSPAGAMPRKPGAQGKASFGFVSRYQRGANVPTGSTELHFSAGAFHFRSTRYDWLVVAGARAQYKGSGTVNGDGDYGFLLTATDGQRPGGGGTDRLRLKVWDQTSGGIVYDNQIGANDNADPSTALSGGSIVIHP